LSYLGVGGVSIAGYVGIKNGGFGSLLPETTGGGNQSEARKEYGSLTTGIAAIEWLDNGKLRIEAADDSAWQGVVVETQSDEWIASANKSPTDDDVTLDPLAASQAVLPEEHKLRILDRELNYYEVGEVDWLETVTLDLSAEATADAAYDAENKQLQIDIKNTGPCAIRADEVILETDNGELPRPVAGTIRPGETDTVTLSNPWGTGQNACSADGTVYDGEITFSPAIDAKISHRVEVPSDSDCSTIPG